MDSIIPFIVSRDDWDLARETHGDSDVFRVPLHRLAKGLAGPRDVPLWIDAGVDGYHHLLNEGDPWSNDKEELRNYLQGLPEYRALATSTVVEGNGPTRNRKRIETFVTAILDACIEEGAVWVSVPQLPHVDGNGRNKINRELAQAAAEWSERSTSKCKLILPAIFTHRNQYKRKTERNAKVKAIADCYRKSGANGVWVVDSDLSDQKGTGSLTDRFGELVQFHEELNEELPDRPIRIAGPYWGMDLILWARGLADCPAIGVGRGYQYHIPGRLVSRSASVRIAIPPLRRWVPVGGPGAKRKQLRGWLDSALAVLSSSDDGTVALRTVKANYDTLTLKEAAQRQTAVFYNEWFRSLCKAEERSLALFQDLSAAYVLGKRLPDLPNVKGPGREPGEVARQFMLNCL